MSIKSQVPYQEVENPSTGTESGSLLDDPLYRAINEHITPENNLFTEVSNVSDDSSRQNNPDISIMNDKPTLQHNCNENWTININPQQATPPSMIFEDEVKVLTNTTILSMKFLY